MDYNLVVGKPVSIPKLINTYSVIVEYMHGDADHYTNQTFNFTPNKQVNPNCSIETIIHVLQEWCKVGWNARCDLLTRPSQLKGWLISIGCNDPQTVLYDLFESDITYDDARAHFENYTIFWYDDKGIKHEVDIFDTNGNLVKYVNY